MISSYGINYKKCRCSFLSWDESEPATYQCRRLTVYKMYMCVCVCVLPLIIEHLEDALYIPVIYDATWFLWVPYFDTLILHTCEWKPLYSKHLPIRRMPCNSTHFENIVCMYPTISVQGEMIWRWITWIYPYYYHPHYHYHHCHYCYIVIVININIISSSLYKRFCSHAMTSIKSIYVGRGIFKIHIIVLCSGRSNIGASVLRMGETRTSSSVQHLMNM